MEVGAFSDIAMTITYGSVCSGIEAATVAWHPLGMRPEWFAEIEPFPSAVLAHHWPDVPNLGDMTALARMVLLEQIPAPDVLVGGTPCQAFSVAGMRNGLADPRGALTIKYVELADAVDHVRTASGEDECVVVWENVPGVLSDKGNAFGCFLGALVGESDALLPSGGKWTDAGCVYGPRRAAAWRVLDAQYFGLAQRRRRVFVVASARAGFDPAAVLFEQQGVRRDHPPRRGAPENLAATVAGGARKRGGYSTDDVPCVAKTVTANARKADREDCMNLIAFGGGANCQQTEVATALSAHPGGTRMDAETETFIVAGTLQANGKAAGSATSQDAESGLLVVHGTQDPCVSDQAFTLGRNSGQENAVLAFSCKYYGADAGELAPTLRAMGHGESHANAGGQVAVAVIQNATRGKDQNGLGISPGDEPMYTLDQASQHAVCVTGEITHTLAKGQQPPTIVSSAVRRLTPRECERLQGFDDDHTLIPWRGKPAEECPDGPRYKAIGNSKAVYVIRWIGIRLKQQLERQP